MLDLVAALPCRRTPFGTVTKSQHTVSSRFMARKRKCKDSYLREGLQNYPGFFSAEQSMVCPELSCALDNRTVSSRTSVTFLYHQVCIGYLLGLSSFCLSRRRRHWCAGVMSSSEDEERIVVLYASQTGTAADVGERIGREARRRHYRALVASIDVFPLVSLSGATGSSSE